MRAFRLILRLALLLSPTVGFVSHDRYTAYLAPKDSSEDIVEDTPAAPATRLDPEGVLERIAAAAPALTPAIRTRLALLLKPSQVGTR